MAWKIMIVDDHQLLLDGLSIGIRSDPDFDLIGIAHHGKELLQLLETTSVRPHIVLMDIEMPLMDGLEASRVVKKNYPEIKVVLLTMHEAPIYHNKAIVAQADGIITKTIGQLEMMIALKKISEGCDFFCDRLTGRKLHDSEQDHTEDTNLTERETEILKKIALGLSNTEISSVLGISARTVDTHRTNLKRKLAVSSIAGLVRYAFRQGLLT